MTVVCPDEFNIKNIFKSRNYWVLSSSTVRHQERKKVEFDLYDLKIGDTIGCSIHEDGTLHYYVNGKDRGIGWNDLPINRKMYGIVDVYGRFTKIRSLLHNGKCKCILTWL